VTPFVNEISIPAAVIYQGTRIVKKLSLYLAAMLSVFFVGLSETSWGRGFGGMHGGMHGGMGGMHAGGFGGMGGGGGRPGGFGGGGDFGGARPGGNFGGARLGGAGGGFGGARPGGNFGGNSAFDRDFGGDFGSGGRLGAGNTGLAGVGGDRFPGGGAGGFGGKGPEKGGLAGLGGKEGLGAGEGGLGKSPDRNQLNNFLGLPSDGGMNKLSANHIHVGDTQIGGNQVNRNQIGGDQVNRNRIGQTQVGRNQLGRNQLGRDARGMTRYSNQDLRLRGDEVRRDFDGRGYYNADWYRRYPGAWSAGRYAYGNVWTAATWDSMDGWFGYGNTEPTYYDYGNNVTYQDNSVYMNGQDMGTSEQYYDQAQTLAETGSKAQTTDDTQWMPLGVFAMTHGKQNNANLIVQLAVDKRGIIRGNYTAKLANDTKPIQGSVDKKTQMAAFTIGDDTKNVIETGIYNLTKAEAPILVHFGEDKTEQWTLVRLNQDGQDGGASQSQQGSQKQ
jgi:hypothetical protein